MGRYAGIAVVAAALAAATASACGEPGTDSRAIPNAGHTATTTPGPAVDASSATTGLTPKQARLEVRSTTEDRYLGMMLRFFAPAGWRAGDDSASNMVVYSRPTPAGAPRRPAAVSNLTVAATCHGPCRVANFVSNIDRAPDIQRALVGTSATLKRRELIRPGVWGFIAVGATGAVPQAGATKPAASASARTLVGVTHYQPGWPKPVYCMAMLVGDDVSLAGHLYRTCSDMTVSVSDPVLTADILAAESAKLGRCPSANKVSYRTTSRVAGEPKLFGDVKSGRAVSAGVGHVFIELSTAKTPTTPLKALAGAERVLRVELRVGATSGDVISGDYLVNSDQAQSARAVLHVAGGKSFGLGTATGKVAIAARTRSRICGTLSLTGKRQVEATFDVSF